jgi:hypothetical protein
MAKQSIVNEWLLVPFRLNWQSKQCTLLRMANTEDHDTPGFASPEFLDYVVLQAMPLNEAELARLKLESEGIHCSIAGENSTTMNPLLFHSVKLLVSPADLPRAREILESPADDSMEGEYVDEPFRCPKCHRKGLEILPARGVRKVAWCVFWFVVALIVLDRGVKWMNAGDHRAQFAWDANTGRASAPTIIAFGCVSFYLIVGRRDKVCSKCGWRSTGNSCG